MTDAAIFGAVIGAIVTMIGGVIVQWQRNRNAARHDTSPAKAAPYSDIAARLSAVEKQAAMLPMMQAHLWQFHLWSEQIIGWSQIVRETVNGKLGDPLPPMPPPPKVDRRLFDHGRPYGFDRRDHAAEAASPEGIWGFPPPAA